MTIDFAVDRLYEVGWNPSLDAQMEELPNGRKVPSVAAVRQEFAQAGLQLTIKHNLMFGCHRATWGAGGEVEGTVVGDSEMEAAVYALAQLRTSQRARGMMAAGV